MKDNEIYECLQPEDLSLEEKLYMAYLQMRKNLNKEDIHNLEFKRGFLAGVKIFNAIFLSM